MSIDVYIKGVISTDTEKWNKMKKIYNAYVEANLSVPNDIREFFKWTNPNVAPAEGMQVEIDNSAIIFTSDSDRCADCYTVDLRKIPTDVTHIIFEMSF